jgi:hypothetical protein
VDGMVGGTWSVTVKAREATIVVTPFGRLATADRVALIDEGERLARFIAPASNAHRVTIE